MSQKSETSEHPVRSAKVAAGHVHKLKGLLPPAVMRSGDRHLT